MTNTNAATRYRDAHSKNPVIGVLLALFLGPLGLLYSNFMAGIILGVVAIIGAATIIVPLLCWAASIPLSLSGVYRFNQQVRARAKL